MCNGGGYACICNLDNPQVVRRITRNERISKSNFESLADKEDAKALASAYRKKLTERLQK